MLNAQKIKVIHADIKKTLDELAKRHGLVLGNGTRISYNDETFKFTAEFGDKESTGGVDPKYLNCMKKHGWKFGLSESHIGKTFEAGEGKVTILGMSGYSKVAAKAADGKVWLYRANMVAMKMGAK